MNGGSYPKQFRISEFGFRNGGKGDDPKSAIRNRKSEIPRGRLYFCENVENPSIGMSELDTDAING